MEEPLVRITRRGEDEFISLTRPFEIMTQRCDGRQITSCHIRPGCLRRSEMAMGEHPRRLHYHDYFELMVVLEGELVQRIEQGVYHYHRGDACLLGRNARHGEQHDRPFYIVFLNLAPDYVRRLLDEDELVDESGARRLADGVLRRFLRQELEGTARFERGYLDFTPTLSAGGADRLAALLDRLTEEMLSQQPGSNLLVRGLLARIFGLLEDGGQYHASHMRPDSRTEDMLVARVANYLRERSGRELRDLMGELERRGLLARTGGEYPVVTLTATSMAFLRRASLSIAAASECHVLLSYSHVKRNAGQHISKTRIDRPASARKLAGTSTR